MWNVTALVCAGDVSFITKLNLVFGIILRAI